MRYLMTRYPPSSERDGSILDEDGHCIFRVTNTTHPAQAGGPLARGIVLTDEHMRALAAVWESQAGQDKASIYHDDMIVAEVQRVIPPPPAQRFKVQFPTGG